MNFEAQGLQPLGFILRLGSTLPRDQIIMGIAIAAVCLLGLLGAKWFQRETKKGRRFTEWFGEERGLLMLRLLFAIGILLGVLLATDVIRPMQW